MCTFWHIMNLILKCWIFVFNDFKTTNSLLIYLKTHDMLNIALLFINFKSNVNVHTAHTKHVVWSPLVVGVWRKILYYIHILPSTTGNMTSGGYGTKKSVGRSECGVGKEENMIIALKHLYLRLLKHLTE